MNTQETFAPRLNRFGHIRIAADRRNWLTPVFLIGVLVAAVASFIYLDLPWAKLASRVPDLGDVFWKLGHLDFARWELILAATQETICVAVLSTFYGMLLGLFFGMLAAENVLRIPFLAPTIKALFTFLRAVPTPVWVLLMMVCVGFVISNGIQNYEYGSAGVAILLVFIMAYFTERLFVFLKRRLR